MLIVHQQCPTYNIFVIRKATFFLSATQKPKIKVASSFVKTELANRKYHWIHVQWKNFDGG